MKTLLRWIRDSERSAVQYERAEPGVAPRAMWFERMAFLSFVTLGLLCHLIIFRLLSFPLYLL